MSATSPTQMCAMRLARHPSGCGFRKPTTAGPEQCCLAERPYATTGNRNRKYAAIDHQRGLGQNHVAMIMEIRRSWRSGMVSGGGNKDEISAPLGFWDMGEVICQCCHRCQARSIVESALKIRIHMRQNYNVFVGHARKSSKCSRGLQTLPHLGLQLHLDYHRASRADQITQRLPVLPAHPKTRNGKGWIC